MVRETIESEAIKLLLEHGVKLEKVVTKPEGKATFGAKLYPQTAYQELSSESIYGFNFSEYYLQDEDLAMVQGKTSLINAEQQYVSGPETFYHGLYFFNKIFLTENKVAPFNEENGFEQFMLKLTSRLPDGYFYYESPSMSRNLIPAIYMKGVKYQFINPEVKHFLDSETVVAQ